MRKSVFLLICSIFLFAGSAIGQQTVRVDAIKANDYGVVYSLPKTSVVLTLKIKETTNTRGDFYQYAKRYLDIDQPITENNITYSIEEIIYNNVGVPDTDNSFMVSFKSNSFEPYLTLTKEGLICAVNSNAEALERTKIVLPTTEQPSANARRFFSEEILAAGSSAKQAELIAKQIFEIRQSHKDILTGEAESMPPDGNAYKLVIDRLTEREKALISLFAGNIQNRYFTKDIVIDPTSDNLDRKVIARFSQYLGLVDADNLAGEPIYVTISRKNPQKEMEISEKEAKNLDKKFSHGLVYNIPGKAQLIVEYKNKKLINIETEVVQFGSKDVLVKKMFDNMKKPIKVIFHTDLGSIKQVIQ